MQHRVQAVFQSMAHKFAVEGGVQSQAENSWMILEYPYDLVHPWPREFTYRTEIFATCAADGVVAEVNPYLQPEAREQVLNVFCEPGAPSQSTYQLPGYELAWSNVLLVKGLETTPSQSIQGPGSIRAVSSTADVNEINAMEPENLSSSASLADPHLHEYVIEMQAAIVGKTQFVTIDQALVYVSDMYVKPEYRNMGLGHQLLQHIHFQAQKLGRQECVLIPSRMTRESGFYANQGYREQALMHVMIPQR
jgi:GNAT superfamily N-acetyltransferase